MADILLFNQYYTSEKETPELVTAMLPYNLLCLATYLREKSMDCKIYELGIFDVSETIMSRGGRIRCGLPDRKIINIIKEEKPKIIGIGCMYTIHFWAITEIARLIKETDPTIKVVLGGSHATIFAGQILKEQSFDYVVRGEGEITFHELCSGILSGQPGEEEIAGITYRTKNGEIKSNPDRSFIKDIDILPIPDYSLVDLKKYADPSFKSPYHMRHPPIGILTSRGCPYKCVFCTVREVWKRNWRARSAQKTVDEIEILAKNYGIREIYFMDDNVSLDKKRWKEILEEIIKRKLDIKWTVPNGIAFWTLDKELLKLMKASGCYRLTFGIESANEGTKKFIGKPYPLEMAKNLIKYANEIGMWTICTNIIGFPYETKEAIQDTVDFAKYSGTDFATFYLLALHPVSDVYGYFKKENLLDFDFVFTDNWFVDEKFKKLFKTLYAGGFSTKYLTAKELRKIQQKAYKDFILYRAFTYIVNPFKLLKKIRSFEDFRFVTKLLFMGVKILFRSLLTTVMPKEKSVYNLFYKSSVKIK